MQEKDCQYVLLEKALDYPQLEEFFFEENKKKDLQLNHLCIVNIPITHNGYQGCTVIDIHIVSYMHIIMVFVKFKLN